MGKEKNAKLPEINLSVEEIAELIKNVKLDLQESSLLPKMPYFRCDLCRDSKNIVVYGPGPNMPCPVCSSSLY